MTFNVFPLAPSARNNNIGTDLIVFDEIRTIERAILVAIQAGQLETTVDGTTMTTIGDAVSEDYWKVWDGTLEDRLKEIQMNNVETYFKDRKYSIGRQPNNRYTISSATMVNSGTGYVSGDVLTLNQSGAIVNTPATITVDNTTVISFTIASGGAGYQVGDVLHVASGTYTTTPATFTVTSIGTNGVVTGINMTSSGEYTTNPTGLGTAGVTTIADSGSGIGLMLYLTLGIKEYTLSGGSYGKLPTTSPLGVTGGSGTGATFQITGSSIGGTTFNWLLKW